jgi:hypothetical protein
MKNKLEAASEMGYHNQNFDATRERLLKGGTYKDLSTIWVTPVRDGVMSCKVISAFVALQRPMNQPCVGPIFVSNMEVGDAYNQAIEMILADPNLSKFKYLLTIESDNLPPSDGLIKLYEGIQKYDGVGGLYYTKGEGGQPMIYGDPNVFPRNFVPQVPRPETLQHSNGLGFQPLPIRDVQEDAEAVVQDSPRERGLFFTGSLVLQQCGCIRIQVRM